MTTPKKDAGISNRESAADEQQERQQYPPVDELADAQGADSGTEITPDETQTSRKAGSRSSEQKAAESRHAEDATPASTKVPGAFGKERGR